MNPSASLPVAMGTDARLEGLYRHLSTPEVTVEELLRPHVQQTIARLAKTECAYAIHDTTGFVFGGQSRRKGLGHVDNSKDQGFLAHVTLTVEPGPERLPLGVLAVGTRSRVGKKTQAESARWEVGVSLAEEMVPKGKLIHVADRESDIYPLLSRAIVESWRFVFRAAQDRALWDSDNAVSLLFEEARGQKPRFEFDVPLTARKANAQPKQRAAHPPRNSRIASLSASATRVKIKRPTKRKDGLPYVEINVVRVWEPHPPNGETPVEWLLLTSEPVETEPQLRAIIEAYRARWVIEEFFCAIKTGCAYEEKQLESEKSLLNLLAYCIVIAYALLVMRSLLRSRTERPATDVLTERQLTCLRLLSQGKLEKKPTATQALMRLAALGGHLKNNGPPGWRTLSRGYSKLLDGEEMYTLLIPETSDQS